MPLTRASSCFALVLLAGCTADSRAPEQTTPVPSSGMARYSTFGVDMLCNHDTWGTDIDAAARKVRREKMAAALATVTDPELAALRDACAVRVLVPVT